MSSAKQFFVWGPESRMKFFKSSKPKCERCGVRESTGEDGLCDNCRYMILLDNVIESRAAAA